MQTTIDDELKHSLQWTLFALSLILVRLLYLQIIEHHSFFHRGTKNFLRSETIQSPRGNILDCRGKLLATNRPLTSLYWQGTGNRKLTEEQRALLEDIEKVTNCAFLSESLTSQLNRTEKSSTHCRFAYDLPFPILSRILEKYGDQKNIVVKTDFKRYYPNNNLACHVLGYISHVDLESIGKMGIEKILNQRLEGQQGKRVKKINSLGTSLEITEVQEALQGQNIITTIDLSLQKIAERVFPEDKGGCIIIMDPEEGSLKTVLSRPDFDPALFLSPISHTAWQEMQEGKPFLNRPFDAVYPPASIFKLVTMAAALEANYVNENDIVSCKGYVRFKGRNYHCAHRAGHGNLSLREVMAKSCNSIFYELGIQMPIELLSHYAKRFGLGEKTGVLFSEKSGLVPNNEWKVKTTGERWWQGETLSATIGQSYLLVTPIQIVSMIGSIFTGYRVRPRILEHERVMTQPVDIQPETRLFLQESMRLAVQQGTGRTMSTLKDITLHAKTGTAQVTAFSKRKMGPNCLEHAWFVCHMQYKDEKPLVMMIVIEHAGASRHATNVAKKFIAAYQRQIQTQN